MPSHQDIPIQATVDSPRDIKNAEDAIKKAREDNDPQTVFYLNPTSTSTTTTVLHDFGDLIKDIQVTKYNWATKIEQTVQLQFSKGENKERHTIQTSWDRASYRAKLVDYLTRTTPWFMFVADDSDGPDDQELTGDYYHDKLIYQKAIHDYLQARIPEVPEDRLRFIEKHISEILSLSQDKVHKVQRFAVAFPLVDENEPVIQPGLRTVTFSFERKKDKEKTMVEISRTSYEAKINKKVFDEQKFDQKMLDLGKPLVKEWTLDITA